MRWIAVAIVTMAAGCALNPTPYQERREPLIVLERLTFWRPAVGYQHFEVVHQPDVLYLRFVASRATPAETVERYWRQRATELCPQGYESTWGEAAALTQTWVRSVEGYIRCRATNQ